MFKCSYDRKKKEKGDMKKHLEVMDASTTLMVLMAQLTAYVQIHNPELCRMPIPSHKGGFESTFQAL